ncbi:MAG: aldose 1-epimerase family protein [Acetatifactor sp.]|nr:aldose 1-epimerase family protein [Acetatifactor sp.]
MLEYCRLENGNLTVEVVPERGGKTISIFDKLHKFELLFQRADFGTRAVDIGSPFGQGDASGFDDAFPGIDREQVMINGETVVYPDHGEVWSCRMDRIDFDDNCDKPYIVLAMDSRILPYHYEKKIQLTDSNEVTYSYLIQNTGTFAFPCLWACHCLVRYEEDMRLIYPEGVTEFQTVLNQEAYPPRYDYGRVPPRQMASMVKYYALGKVSRGYCGYDYPTQGMQCRFHYDSEKLPYLGFWLTAGGYQGDYNCALEPTNGYYDNIATARKNHACYSLMPGETFQFDFKVTLNPITF